MTTTGLSRTNDACRELLKLLLNCTQQDLNFMQDVILEELKREISERPTTKQVEDLRKQVKILQVRHRLLLSPQTSWPIYLKSNSHFWLT
jgi:hypothetical protein